MYIRTENDVSASCLCWNVTRAEQPYIMRETAENMENAAGETNKILPVLKYCVE